MALTLLKAAGVSTVAGIVDLATETIDAQQSLVKPYENISDWARTLATIGGYAGARFLKDGTWKDVSMTLAVAYEPLLLRSVYKAVTKGRLAGQYGTGGQGAGYGSVVPVSGSLAPPPQVNQATGYRPFVP